MGLSSRVAIVGSLLAARFAEASPYSGIASNTTAGHVVYTTEVVTALTTYCPAATTLTYNDKTYTISTATTLTITDCPCTISKPVTPTTSSTPKDECAEECYDAYNKCRGQANANRATCASEYASCLGYSPFGDDGSLITPTACSKTAGATTTPAGPVYTTEVVTAFTTYCPEATTLSYGNKTYTITEPTTFTITDCPCTISKPVSTPASKPVTKPVYTTEVVTAITTYCPEPTTLTYNNMTYTITEPTTFTVTNCPCTVTKPLVPTSAVPTTPASECPEMCSNAYNKCRGQSGANMSTCAAEYASCLGYSPFKDGSLITPTACSTGASASVTAPGSATAPGAGTGTGSGSSPTTPAAIPAGAAGVVAPGGLLLALGALIMV
ncbi:hypothetical protein G7Z17_g6311 [Cylindrodendrum hubeiense]|uniref:Cell wall glycoprotein n=1 Tax=Cylindrodendrum hubeiense TaxID=595255 RepID=A0A9P5HFE9_9HYPO|nr:hypothetical protein G7Z17_g6311 [Cylindrodendrum hubeiense]